MERTTNSMLRIGDWRVDPAAGQVSRNGETARLEERTMRLLVCLAQRPGEIVSIDDLLNQVWPEVTVTPDSVYQAVASLRRLLGDDPRQPAYIATVPRLGYRMVAAVGPWTDASRQDQAAADQDAAETGAGAGSASPGNGATRRGRRTRARLAWSAGTAVCVGVVVTLFVYYWIEHESRIVIVDPPLPAQNSGVPGGSIAVLPFLDLTEGMKNEEFADGMTEELIGRLSKVPNLRVPAPTASFYYKGKQIPVADIASALGVVYVLDGSVRKAGSRVRVAARLVRAENGYVLWTENYDRPFDDILMVQDDIAGEVTKALKASIAADEDRGLTP